MFLQSCVWSLMVRLFNGVWSEGMRRMSMELQGAHGGLLWWLLGYELVAWFGSTGLDLQIGIACLLSEELWCNHAAINDLGATWLPRWVQSRWKATELKCAMKSP
jgi:hypothetical protein